MAEPLSRRRFTGTLAASVAVGAAGASPLPADPPREPLTAPEPPAPRGLGVQAALRFEALLGEFPETRVAARRPEITRQIAANLLRGRVLAAANLTHADGPGPLWAAYRDDGGAIP